MKLVLAFALLASKRPVRSGWPWRGCRLHGDGVVAYFFSPAVLGNESKIACSSGLTSWPPQPGLRA
ncbi:hypothetical protein ASG76_06120 [Nocardioides sp. Soil774]|nr:hypothetical protein ASG76_06120 [Nocardioides sp. Soil774]